MRAARWTPSESGIRTSSNMRICCGNCSTIRMYDPQGARENGADVSWNSAEKPSPCWRPASWPRGKVEAGSCFAIHTADVAGLLRSKRPARTRTLRTRTMAEQKETAARYRANLEGEVDGAGLYR